VPQKKKNPSKGRSVVLRAEAGSPPCPAMVVHPMHPTPIDATDAVPVEDEERTTRLSFTLKIPGFGRFKIDSARLFRRRK
jgi:hypothetical protein